MATKNLQKIVRYGGVASNPMLYPEAASQSFKVGQLLCIDTAGRVKAIADAGVKLWGIAMEDASGTTDNLVQVDLILPGDRLIVSCYHATAASAVMANANVGDTYQVITSSNVTYLDKSSTSTPLFKVLARMPEDAATDIYPRLICTILSACLQSVDCAQES